jgi:hypothetical protein
MINEIRNFDIVSKSIRNHYVTIVNYSKADKQMLQQNLVTPNIMAFKTV